MDGRTWGVHWRLFEDEILRCGSVNRTEICGEKRYIDGSWRLLSLEANNHESRVQYFKHL